jgi:hypothetical protein
VDEADREASGHREEARNMDENYKGHLIQSGAEGIPGSSEWRPSVRIIWHEEGRESIKYFPPGSFRRKFETEKEAESYAHEMSKKWIDDGKPDILRKSLDRD